MDQTKRSYDELINAIKENKLNVAKSLFDQLSKEKMSRDLGREVLREACMYNQLDMVKYVIEHDNKQALEDFNRNFGFIFWIVTENKFWNIANYFICELNMPLSWDLKRALNDMDKDDAEKINHMFEMREVKQSLDKDLDNKEKTKNNKKIKV